MRSGLVSSICFALLTLAATSAASASAHAASDTNPGLTRGNVTVDAAIIRRHQALGRLQTRPVDRPGSRGPEAAASNANPAVGASADDAFDWGDAATGAAVAIAAISLVGVAALGLRRLTAPTDAMPSERSAS